MGCGVGGPAREIARFSEAHVTGLNNNAYQVFYIIIFFDSLRQGIGSSKK